ncbi:MAG: sulfotransferase domain-containing protein [Caldilineaceae bacterium]|nr:sulfotransferase domain-containing protein [Caldilineaceae bacterium]
MNLPNFLIIGATKSGTTSLFHALQQHPQIFMSAVKEPHFFAYVNARPTYQGPGDERTINRMIISEPERYANLFREKKSEQRVMGEASAMYIYVPDAPMQIHHYQPQMKLVAILRNPVDRAYSAYQHMRRDGREPLADFRAAIGQEDQRRQMQWSPIFSYLDMGYYALQLRRYYALFPTMQLKVLLYEDLRNRWEESYNEICTFLEVDPPAELPQLAQLNKSGTPKSELWHKILRRPHPLKARFRSLLPTPLRRKMITYLINRNLSAPPQMGSAVRQELTERYRHDILQLQDLIQRDLSHWLTESAALPTGQPVYRFANQQT